MGKHAYQCVQSPLPLSLFSSSQSVSLQLWFPLLFVIHKSGLWVPNSILYDLLVYFCTFVVLVSPCSKLRNLIPRCGLVDSKLGGGWPLSLAFRLYHVLLSVDLPLYHFPFLWSIQRMCWCKALENLLYLSQVSQFGNSTQCTDQVPRKSDLFSNPSVRSRSRCN